MKKFFKFFSIMLMAFLTTNVLAYSGNADDYVQYDAFAQSEVVNARLSERLFLKNANVIFPENSGYELTEFSIDYNPSPLKYIVYHGHLDIPNTSGSEVEQVLPGPIKVRFEKALLLADGRKADLEITISDIKALIKVNAKNNDNSLIANMKNEYHDIYYLPLISYNMGAISEKIGVAIDNGDGTGIRPDGFSAGYTVLSYGETLRAVNVLDKNGNPKLDEDGNPEMTLMTNNEDVRINERIRFKYQIKAYVDNGQFDTPLDGDYKILFGAYDIDVSSNVVALDGTMDTLITRLNDEYTESLELVDGFGTIHSGLKDHNAQYGTSNKYEIWQNRLKIRPNADIARDTYSVKGADKGELNDKYNGNYLSGFLTSARVSGEGSTFYWTGSSRCGTTLFTNFEVLINQKHNNGGTVGVTSNINSNNVNLGVNTNENYFSGSTATYTYTPSKGYYVNNVLVNNVPVNFDRNGSSYEFDNLIYNPLLSNAQPSLTRSIEVQFAPYNFELHYLHEDKSEDENLMPHKDMTYDEEGKLDKNKYSKDNYVFYRWKVLDENKEEILDNNGKPILLKNEADLSNIYELDVNFDGGKFYLQAQFTEKSILNPKTYDSNSFLFIIITFISFGGIVTLLVKNSKKLKKSN